MYYKILYAALVAFLVLNPIEGRKSRRNKRPKEEEDATLQPSVVSYSTFGFNDVGAYDGFVPSSPDYANYLTTVNQESATRLYAPAFPTASDNTGFDNSFGSPSNGYSLSDPESGQQANMMAQTGNFFNMPQFDSDDNQQNKLHSLTVNGQYVDNENAPIYGTKLGSKSKKQTNATENNGLNNFSVGHPSAVSMNFNFQADSPFAQNIKQTLGESHSNFNNVHTPPSAYPPIDNEDFAESATNNGMLKFPKVVDFTKMNYPTEIENKFLYSSFNPTKNLHSEKRPKNVYEDKNSKYMHQTTIFKEISNSDSQDVNENTEKQSLKKTSYTNPETNYVNTPPTKNIFKGTPFKTDVKDYKNKYSLSNYTDLKHWDHHPFKGYKYATNYSSTSFKFDSEEPKKQTSNHFEELVPASSNMVDLNNYQDPNTDFYSNFKKMPEIKPVYEHEYDVPSPKEKHKPEEYESQIKNAFSDGPIATSQWGNIFKSTEYSSHKHHPKRPIYTEDPSNDVVHIPKRPQSSKYHYGKNSENTPSGSSDWVSYSKRPSNTKNRPTKDWYRDNYNTKFKTEEDLLDLRNHDTSNPSYLPTYRPNDNDISNENEYKKLVEKWRQSYWKAKFRETYPDFEGYSSESKPLHVPIPKPYPIEVPHPVIVPVPQPYPVRVPIPKPVAVPVIRELTVTIEKPVPYPVVKKVPYPLEKPVPMPVEKEVAVPVEKPYPVHIPHVRPVFHHKRPREDFEVGPEDEDDYFPRPESAKKQVLLKKKPKSTRNRQQQRPTRMTYQDRNVRRPRRPADSHEDLRRPRRPYSSQIGYHYSTPYRYRDVEMEYESEPSSDYFLYCKRTGNC